MLFLILTVFAMIMLLDQATRQGRLDRLKQETSFKLFALRDKLRREAIDGQIQCDNWFDFLDTTITGNIGALEKRTVWELAVLIVVHRDDPKMKQAYERLVFSINSPGKENFRNHFNAFNMIMDDFLYERHRALMRGVSSLSKMTRYFQERMRLLKESASRMLLTSPETSTLLAHCSK